MKQARRGIIVRLALALVGAGLMLAPTAQAQAGTETGGAPAGLIPAGTPVVVTLAERLRSGQARAGQTVRYTVAQDVTVGGTIVIPAGTPAFGTVEASRGAGAFGRAGRLRIGCDSVTLPSGVRVPLQARDPVEVSGRSQAGAAGLTGGAFGLVVGAATYTGTDLNDNLFNAHPDHFAPTAWGLAAGIVSGALIGGLFHGGDVTLSPGRRLELRVARDTIPSSR